MFDRVAVMDRIASIKNYIKDRFGATRFPWPRWRSLRTRILVWHGLILTAAIGVFATIVIVSQQRSMQESIDAQLSAAHQVVQGQLDAGLAADSIEIPDTFPIRRFRRQQDGPWIELRAPEGDLIIRRGERSTIGSSSTGSSSTGSSSIGSPSIGASSLGASPTGAPSPEQITRFHRRKWGISFYNRGSVRESVSVTPDGIEIRIGRDTGPDWNEFQTLVAAMISGGLFVLAMGLVGGWFLSKRSVAPIAEISKRASLISQQNLMSLDPSAELISVSDADEEFGVLVNTLNLTFERLGDAFAKQREFTADASHELRTPLAVIQMHQELALSKPRTAEEYRESIVTCQRAAERMKHLVESLLTLARWDSAEGKNETQANLADQVSGNRVSLLTVAEKSVAEILPLMQERRIQATVNGVDGKVAGDPLALARVITNLLRNAVAYSDDDSAVTISIRQDDDRVVLSVADQGCGIAREHLPFLFDRFYRVDKQRSRPSGVPECDVDRVARGDGASPQGTGLGLAICRGIIQGHGGEITIESEIGRGTEVAVVLPAIAPETGAV